MEPVVVVEKLSKKYQIGKLTKETMLRERLINLLKHPFQAQKEKGEVIWALKDVSLSIERGEVVGIIGRNGAGKSTLLKVLSKITYPTSGKVSTQGRVASLLEVGTGFHEELTGRENVYLNGSILGMKKKEIDTKLDAIVAFSEVERFLDTPIKRYSSGMRLRLGFAVAAHLDPDVLIIDEVLAVGDAGFQKKCLSAMEDLQRGGRTVLFVSHNMAAIENLCTRGVWVDAGGIRVDGKAREVIKLYMATFAGPQSGRSDFNTIDHRHGTADIRYTGLEFLSEDAQPLRVLRSGDALIMRFYYHAVQPIPHPSFGFRLFTEMGTLITETSTWHHGLDFPLIPPGDGWLDLELDMVNLMPARYQLSLWLTGEGQIVYDGLEYCKTLDVESANIYSSNRNLDHRYGVVYFPQRWNLKGMRLGACPSVQSHVDQDLQHS
jgi:lipopolysaccharide transport system ATP-binding protein